MPTLTGPVQTRTKRSLLIPFVERVLVMSAAAPPPQPPGPGTPDDPGADGPPGVPVPVPAELAVAPPGPVLGALLEDIDVETVSGYDTVEVLCAEYRQLCRQAARFYRAVLETGLRTPFSIDTVQRVSWSAPRFPDSGLCVVLCRELAIQVVGADFVRGPVAEC